MHFGWQYHTPLIDTAQKQQHYWQWHTWVYVAADAVAPACDLRSSTMRCGCLKTCTRILLSNYYSGIAVLDVMFSGLYRLKRATTKSSMYKKGVVALAKAYPTTLWF